jgi:hypothetical protein
MSPSNPLRIIPLLWHTLRPTRTTDMEAVALPFWIRKGYDGLTLFGHIITHSKQEAEVFNTRFDALKNHEMIHLYQARATRDSWICFYWKYFVFWMKARRYNKHLRNAGYLLNPFEMEAYRHMNDLHYLDDKESGTTGWHRYAEMTLEERLREYQRGLTS